MTLNLSYALQKLLICGLHFFSALNSWTHMNFYCNLENILPQISQCCIWWVYQLRSLLSNAEWLFVYRTIYLFSNLFRDVFIFVSIMHWMVYVWENKNARCSIKMSCSRNVISLFDFTYKLHPTNTHLNYYLTYTYSILIWQFSLTYTKRIFWWQYFSLVHHDHFSY